MAVLAHLTSYSPDPPAGEGLAEALAAARQEREYLEGRVASLAADVTRVQRERNLARQDVEVLRAEVRGLQGDKSPGVG